MRSLAWIEEIVAVEIGAARGDRHGPVVVLAAAVDAGKRLFVQKHREVMASRDFSQNFHRELIMIGRDIGFFENRRGLELARRHFVVAGLDRNAELIKLDTRLRP